MTTRPSHKRNAVREKKPGRPRWPYLGPPQRVLLFAALGIFLGTVLPWAVVIGRLAWGSPIALMWTFWAAVVTLTAGIVRWRLLAVLSAGLGGGIAVFFSVWQTLRILERCGLTLDCVPGPGLGFLLLGGATALYQAFRLVVARGVAGSRGSRRER